MTTTGTTEAAAVAELAERSTYRDLLGGEGWAAVGLPPGYGVHLVDETGRLPTPARSAGEIVVHDAASFLAVIGQRELDRPAVVYADETQLALVAVFDDDHGATPGWRNYRARVALRPTPEWAAWKKNNEQWQSQEAFAEFVEEHAREFRTPTAADMLDLASTIEGTKTASFKTGVRLKNGARQVQWAEDISASAGQSGQMEIPDRFLIGLVPFYGAGPFEIEAWLRFRIRDGHLVLAYKLDRPDLTERAVFTALVDHVGQELGETIISGPAPLPNPAA